MAWDTLDIGPTPANEKCESLGPNYRPEVARLECRAYIEQLIRLHGQPPEQAKYRITSNPHEFGTYHDVGIRFNSDSEEAVEYAFKVEADTPEDWDDQAMKMIDDALVEMGQPTQFQDRLR